MSAWNVRSKFLTVTWNGISAAARLYFKLEKNFGVVNV